ncbi:MAG: hypothetical protein KF900_13650 [Bacteroidetes bacterium]|nr:hypothetical protein [Bacteroidota bacterium]
MFRQSNIFFLLICIFLCSCSSKFSFQKRRYNKGFHIAHSKTPTKPEKHENKTLAVKSFSNESKLENKPTEEKEILKPENPPQITHPQIHSIVQSLYASENFTNTVSSLKPVMKEIENLSKQRSADVKFNLDLLGKIVAIGAIIVVIVMVGYTVYMVNKNPANAFGLGYAIIALLIGLVLILIAKKIRDALTRSHTFQRIVPIIRMYLSVLLIVAGIWLLISIISGNVTGGTFSPFITSLFLIVFGTVWLIFLLRERQLSRF